ncbi:MAG: response regulator [Deltaproteobacteria bacterium]|nr:response regulator [Deltaproteobacteria bacterium]
MKKNHWLDPSLKTLLLGTITLTFLIFASLLIYFDSRNAKIIFHAAFHHEQKEKGEILAEAIANALETNDFTGLYRVSRKMTRTKDDPDIQGITIYGKEGRRIVHYPININDPHANVETISYPLLGNEGNRLGRLDLQFSYKTVDALIRQDITEIITVVTILTLIFMGLTLLLIHRVATDPIDRLSSALTAQTGSRENRTVIPYQDRNDEIGRLARTFQDVFGTLSRTTDHLRKSQAQMQAIMDNSPAIVTLKQHDGTYIMANRQFETLFGKTTGEILGKSCYDFCSREVADELTEHDREVLRSGNPVHHEEQFFVGENEHVFLTVRFLLPSREDDHSTICAISTEITSLKQMQIDQVKLEEQLRQAQKLESIGQLAGGVAHDFNNMLTGMIGFSTLALRDMPEEHPVRKYLEIIKETGERAASLTNQLLAFSRKQVLEMQQIQLNELFRDLSKMLKRLLGEHVHIELALDPDLPPILADPTQMEQILMNLTVNARDAMPKGGWIKIRTTYTEVSPHEARAMGEIKAGNYVRVTVEDTGEGMTPEVQERIFEPFFTTKSVGQGTGLGLSTVYGIVKQHKGHIVVESEVGKGTRFSLYFFPYRTQIESPADEVEENETARKGAGTILVVDDEKIIREFTKATLAPLGYRIVTADSGREALLHIEEIGEIDLLLTDMVMPGMGGKELAEAVQHKQPGIKVLFMTGYSSAQPPLDKDNHETDLILKPLTPEALAEKIRTMLQEE